MVKRVHKSSDGKYHVAGKKYSTLIGSRAQVHHETAYKTTGAPFAAATSKSASKSSSVEPARMVHDRFLNILRAALKRDVT